MIVEPSVAAPSRFVLDRPTEFRVRLDSRPLGKYDFVRVSVGYSG